MFLKRLKEKREDSKKPPADYVLPQEENHQCQATVCKNIHQGQQKKVQNLGTTFYP